MQFVNKIIIMIIKLLTSANIAWYHKYAKNAERGKDMDQSLEILSSMAAFLAGTLPYAYEIRLFDCAEKGMPIVRRFNTKRGCDDALRKYIRSVLKQPRVVENGMLLNRADVEVKGKLYRFNKQQTAQVRLHATI